MYTNDDILAIMRAAFQPLRCEAKVWDHGEKLRVRVFKDDRALCRMTSPLYLVRTPITLGNLLTDVRNRLERRKFQLDSWELPGYGP